MNGSTGTRMQGVSKRSVVIRSEIRIEREIGEIVIVEVGEFAVERSGTCVRGRRTALTPAIRKIENRCVLNLILLGEHIDFLLHECSLDRQQRPFETVLRRRAISWLLGWSSRRDRGSTGSSESGCGLPCGEQRNKFYRNTVQHFFALGQQQQHVCTLHHLTCTAPELFSSLYVSWRPGTGISTTCMTSLQRSYRAHGPASARWSCSTDLAAAMQPAPARMLPSACQKFHYST
ncbi:hypothetical protein V8E36_001439 [Tilletia maclaganii]